MASNIIHVQAWYARSLAKVFEQLREFSRVEPEQSKQKRLTRRERAMIRRRLRADLLASVEQCNSKKATE